MKTKRWLGLILAFAFAFTLASPAAATTQLVTNGDFESGKTGFYSDYSFLDPSITGGWTLGPECMYTIGTNPNLYHSAWVPPFGDHTSGSGLMMIVNGFDTDPDSIVWQQSVTIPDRETVNVPVKSSFDLYAGQNILVGSVLVNIVEGKICVRFVLNEDAIAEGWVITETHVAVADDASGIPQKKGNPAPGQFPLGETFDPGVTQTGWYCAQIEAGWAAPYAIAAHAVVKRSQCVTIVEAGSADIISDTSTIVAAGNLGTEPHAAVLASPAPGYASSTWTSATGSNSWADPSPSWIWESDPETNPRDGAVVTFEKTFTIPGDPADSTLKIAVDNGYAIWVNGHFVGSDNLLEGVGPVPQTEAELRAALVELTQDYVDTTTWQTVGTFNIPAAYLQTGSNTLTILGVNEYSDTDDPNGSGGFNPLATVENGKNPGGLVFYLDACWNALYECNTYSETAWGGDNDFGGKNWARYIQYSQEFEEEEVARDFEFSFWAANSHPDNPASLDVYFEEDEVGTLSLAGHATGDWQEFTYTLVDPDPGEIVISIIDGTVQAWGDDFCIDDISLE